MRTHTGRADQRRYPCPKCSKKGLGPVKYLKDDSWDADPKLVQREKGCRYCNYRHRERAVWHPHMYKITGWETVS